MPLPKKIPGTIEKQHQRILMLTTEIADGQRKIPETASKADLPMATICYHAQMQFSLSESPVWSEDHQCFYFTDIMRKNGGFYRFTADGLYTNIKLNGMPDDKGIASFAPCAKKDTFIGVL